MLILSWKRWNYSQYFHQMNLKVIFREINSSKCGSFGPFEAVHICKAFSVRGCRALLATFREQYWFGPDRHFASHFLWPLSACTVLATFFSPMGGAFLWGRNRENHLLQSAMSGTRWESGKLNPLWAKRHKLRCELNRELRESVSEQRRHFISISSDFGF